MAKTTADKMEPEATHVALGTSNRQSHLTPDVGLPHSRGKSQTNTVADELLGQSDRLPQHLLYRICLHS